MDVIVLSCVALFSKRILMAESLNLAYLINIPWKSISAVESLIGVN